MADNLIADMPASARSRTGRFMTDAQRAWVPVLRNRGLTLQQIGEVLGGFKHPPIIQILKKAGCDLG